METEKMVQRQSSTFAASVKKKKISIFPYQGYKGSTTSLQFINK
jgi:hypothetical protein